MTNSQTSNNEFQRNKATITDEEIIHEAVEELKRQALLPSNNELDKLDEIAKLMANRIGSPWGEGATYSHDQYDPDGETKDNGRQNSHLDDDDFELFVSDLKQQLSNLIKEIIGEDSSFDMTINNLLTEQRQRATNLGFNIGDKNG